MNLEQQVCSLELAKKLKELGIEQKSIFYHLPFYATTDEENRVSAFTVAELGEMLFPFNIVTYKYKKGKKFIYEVAIQDMEMRINKTYEPSHKADTEANARAKMLIYLLENKLIEV